MLINVDPSYIKGNPKGNKIYIVAIQDKKEKTDLVRAELRRATSSLDVKKQIEAEDRDGDEFYQIGSVHNETSSH